MESWEVQRRQPSSGSITAPGYWWYQARAELLQVVFGPLVPAGAVLVDVGSADGPSVGWLDRRARRISLDVDPSGLQRGGVCASAAALPFAEGGLAAVSVFDVVEHFADDRALAHELFRVLEPGGRIFVSVPAYSWAWSTFDVQAGHHRRYTRRRVTGLLESVGFRVDRATYAFAATLPLFAADRLRAKLKRSTGERVAASKLPPRASAALLGLCRLDEVLLRRMDLAFGSSVFVAAHRPG